MHHAKMRGGKSVHDCCVGKILMGHYSFTFRAAGKFLGSTTRNTHHQKITERTQQMNQWSKALVGAVVAGFLTTSNGYADETAAPATTETAPAATSETAPAADAHPTKGKKAKGKKAKGKKASCAQKDGCSGKDGCKGKEKSSCAAKSE